VENHKDTKDTKIFFFLCVLCVFMVLMYSRIDSGKQIRLKDRRIASMLENCNWPQLSERYDTALRKAVEFIFNRFQPIGIVATGSIIRGNPDATSDLDIEVVHNARFRQRIQKFFNDVPAEIFVNPISWIERYLSEEKEEGRPS